MFPARRNWIAIGCVAVLILASCGGEVGEERLRESAATYDVDALVAQSEAAEALTIRSGSSAVGEPRSQIAAASCACTPMPPPCRAVDALTPFQEEDGEWQQFSADDLWQSWDVAVAQDRNEMASVIPTLVQRLRASGEEDLYRRIAERLSDPMIGGAERSDLIDVLGLSGTPRSVEILLDALGEDAVALADASAMDSEPDYAPGELRTVIRGAVRMPEIAGKNWPLADTLEVAWRRMPPETGEEDLLMIAEGIAYLATESGTHALLAAMADPDASDAQFYAAETALSQLESSDAVPALYDAITQADVMPEIEEPVLDALVSMGTLEAGEALVDYLQDAPKLSDERIARVERAVARGRFSEGALAAFVHAAENRLVADPRAARILDALAYPVEPASARIHWE